MKRVFLILSLFIIILITGCGADNSKKTTDTNNSETKINNEKEYYTAEDYLADASLFEPVWKDIRGEVSAEMLDFEEKWQSFFTPNGRTMSVFHRGEHVYYPENSAESILSAIYAGADLIELDLRFTKDGVLVLMHDDTLTRTTNVELARQQTVGLPESNLISDWNFEQLRRLRLVMQNPDGIVEITNYVIPTFEEALMLCKDKVIIVPDKDYVWDWQLDICPLLEKYDAWRNCMPSPHYTLDWSLERVKKICDDYYEASGYPAPLMTRSKNEDTLEQTAKNIENYGFPKLLRCGEYNAGSYEYYKPYFDKYRIHIECLTDINDTRDVWEQIDDEGYNMIVTNDGVGLTTMIQERYFAEN